MSVKLLSKFIAASLCLYVPVLHTCKVLAQTNTKLSQSSNSSATIEQQLPELVGQWSIKDLSFFGVSVVFTPEGKLYLLPLLSPWFGGSFAGGGFDKPVAYEIPFKINTSTKPMQIDLMADSKGKNLNTIFEMTPDGKMRVELIGLRPGESRPTEFTTGSILLEKISNLTKLPRNTEITSSIEQENKAQQSEARNIIGSMLRAQQAHFLEKNKFSSTINGLEIGIKSETENYSYRIIPQGNQKQQVMMTATSKKPKLKSYTAVVYVVKDKKESITMGGICESEAPSMTAPSKPKIPTKLSEKIQCAEGSRSL